MPDYSARQIYNEIFAAGYSAREVSFYTNENFGWDGVMLNPLDRPMVLILTHLNGSIRIEYFHDLAELHECVPAFHVEYAPDYETMLQLLR